MPMQIDVVYLQWVLVYDIKKAPRISNSSRCETAIYQSAEFDTHQDKPSYVKRCYIFCIKQTYTNSLPKYCSV